MIKTEEKTNIDERLCSLEFQKEKECLDIFHQIKSRKIPFDEGDLQRQNRNKV